MQNPPDEARLLLDRYCRRLQRMVRILVSDRIRQREGTMDIVQSALKSFLRSDPQLDDPKSVLRLLITITRRKAFKKIRFHLAEKRDATRDLNSDEANGELWDLRTRYAEPSHVDVAELEDTIRNLPENLQTIVDLKLQNFTNPEISESLGIPLRSVERRVSELRDRLARILES